MITAATAVTLSQWTVTFLMTRLHPGGQWDTPQLGTGSFKSRVTDICIAKKLDGEHVLYFHAVLFKDSEKAQYI